MNLNLRHEAEIQYPRHCLPLYLDQPNVAEVVVPLWYQYDSLTDSLFRNVTP